MDCPAPQPARASTRVCLGASALFVLSLGVACGGGAPLLHPAQTQNSGRVEASAGAHGQIALGPSRDEIERGRDATFAPQSGARTEELSRGAFQQALVAPGLAPIVGARVGLGGQNEGSIEFTGHRLRLGARHAFEWDSLALSVGIGAASLRTPSSDAPRDADTDGLASSELDWPASGFGADLPVVVGWSSPGRLLALWAGTRFGYEMLRGDFPFASGGTLTTAEASARAFRLSGLAGISAGVAPVWARIGVELSYGAGTAEVALPWTDSETERLEADLELLSISPAAAIAVEF